MTSLYVYVSSNKYSYKIMFPQLNIQDMFNLQNNITNFGIQDYRTPKIYQDPSGDIRHRDLLASIKTGNSSPSFKQVSRNPPTKGTRHTWTTTWKIKNLSQDQMLIKKSNPWSNLPKTRRKSYSKIIKVSLPKTPSSTKP